MGSKKLIKDKGRKAVIYKGAKCLNCGHPLELTDKFCSNCSQINSTKQLSIKDFLDEFFVGSTISALLFFSVSAAMY
ncbi:MAG: putative nucleic acid-binding Zn ribbon protein [bacterium]|jgi:predicted nucleic acid-binding Zn ribbon protein